jgi:hypothetical protein
MALNVTPRRRRGSNASIVIGRIEIDNVAQKNFAIVKLITPDNDSLKCEWAFTEPCHHSLAAGLDTLGDCNFTFTRKQFHRAHVAKIDAKRVIGEFCWSFAGPRSQNRPLPNCGQLILRREFLLRFRTGRCLTHSLDVGVGVVPALNHARTISLAFAKCLRSAQTLISSRDSSASTQSQVTCRFGSAAISFCIKPEQRAFTSRKGFRPLLYLPYLPLSAAPTSSRSLTLQFRCPPGLRAFRECPIKT